MPFSWKYLNFNSFPLESIRKINLIKSYVKELSAVVLGTFFNIIISAWTRYTIMWNPNPVAFKYLKYLNCFLSARV